MLEGLISAKLADKHFEKDVFKTIKRHAFVGALIMMIPDFENAAYALKAGEMSAPFKSTVGYHIIYMTDRHPFESYEYHRGNILKFLEQRGVKEASANAYLDSVSSLRGITRAELVNELHKK